MREYVYCPLLKSMKLTCTSSLVGWWSQTGGWSAFPSANNCQGQLQTSRSVTVEGTAEFQKCLCRINFLQRGFMTFFLTLGLSDDQEGPTFACYWYTIMYSCLIRSKFRLVYDNKPTEGHLVAFLISLFVHSLKTTAKLCIYYGKC